ncbi:Oligopeptide transport ATP-binding protein OppF (TC 3.A.1.5.1) [Patulibacter medicamentivorans]|uniref:Oligopeptide transport ATP-binding protein OppF (TC 3.A.1.5.1) n=1 Tax=Patulibacter medicamentivorans TaxID=1097667 RepID=H0E345_9ACTN|nr:ATP-binding cassette domain-containing protein [Patulibacter medicamentivorans]EHN11911.1 Oligopeptide transport ATP-binding protein OppF (TC 3.A.1.5.1) [Patulibacter medicamentivorans]
MSAADEQSPARDAILEVRDLRKTFGSGGGVLGGNHEQVHAVNGVSFDVLRGETFGLVGESGCGKSTTARMICRLEEPTSGEIRFEGTDVAKMGRKQLLPFRRDVQMVFQDPYSSLNPRHTVGSIIGEPFIVHGVAKDAKERTKRVQDLMDLVGLNPEHYNRLPHEFSGGQRQRIGIARALALEPKLLIADEPVSALDVSIQAQILNLLRRLQRDLGLSLLFIAHDLSVVRYMCDRIAVMFAGEIVEMADSAQLFAAPQHEYTQRLLDAVPIPEPGARKRQREQQAEIDGVGVAAAEG